MRVFLKVLAVFVLAFILYVAGKAWPFAYSLAILVGLYILSTLVRSPILSFLFVIGLIMFFFLNTLTLKKFFLDFSVLEYGHNVITVTYTISVFFFLRRVVW